MPNQGMFGNKAIYMSHSFHLTNYIFLLLGNLIQSLIGSLDDSDSEDNTARSNLHASDLD
jgi:hypothetical protein